MGFPTLDGVSYYPQYFQQPAQTVPPPQPQEQFHTVENGESLESIAQKYSTPEAPVTAQDIADRNQIDAGDVQPGQSLIVPTIKQHAAPKAAPNATPEQGKSDQAMSKYLTAEDNLTAFESGYQRNHNDPDYQPLRSGYASQADTARTELRDAIGAEIKAEFAAHSRPTGDIFDSKAIEQYGAAVIKRYENDPAGKAAAEAAVKDFGVQHEVDTALSTANAMGDAKGAVESLSRDLSKLSPEAQSRLLSSPGFDKLMDEKIVPSFTKPLQGEPWENARNGASAPPKESLLQLQALVEKADPRVANELAGRGVDALNDFFQRAEKDGYSIRLGIEGTTALVQIAGRVGNTADGLAVVQRMADLPVDASQIHLAVADGARPDLLVAIAKAGGGDRITATAIEGVKTYAGSLNGDVDKLAKATDELTWLISNHGGSMTPDQLNKAIQDYTADKLKKDPNWEKNIQAMEEKVAQGGQTLLDQIESLSNLPPDQKAAADKAIEGILGDSKSSYAISLALKKHPEYIDTEAGKRLMQKNAYDAKLGEQGLKLTKELANAYIRNDVLSAAQNYDPRNPASIQQAEQAIERLKNPTLVKALGMDVDSSKYQSYVKLVDELKKSLPAAGDGTQQIVDKLKTHAEAMDNVDKRFTAEGHRPTFEKNQPVGQVLRMVGVGFATIGYLNSQGKANDGQFTLANRNDIKAIVDAASLGQKGTELAVGLGMVAENSALGRFGAGNRANDNTSLDPGRMTRADRVFGHLSAGLDYWAAATSYSAGDNVRAGLYAVSGVGGTMAALSGTSLAASLGAGSWLGPVGIALVAIGTIGLTMKDRVDHSNAHMNETSAKFLSHAGFGEAASTALVDQSGEGWSPVTLLARYASDKGYKLDDPADQQKFALWIKGLDSGKLERLRDEMHHALDDIDGDVGKFGGDTTVYRPEKFIHGGNGMAVKVPANISTIGHLDAVIRDLGLPELPKA
ncbi:LysM peptidoglycan-binding domain-containing protein [Lysobacter firmicutimachus]|uniref:LysM peptidoglycan-binding domain-containing protein n=1 Tax=Lysobacter firmicutimachus TaxID=1792846 RepID=A0ABU8D7R2_9GAMM